MTPEEIIVEGGKPFYFKGNHVGVLLSHGFTGTTSGMKPLGEHLHKTEGWTVLGPRLKGHGETPRAMALTTAEDWIRSLEMGLETLQQTCSTIFVVGLSMGGCLTLYLAAMHPKIVKAIVPINACLHFDSPELAALAFQADAPTTITGLGSDIKDPNSREIVYQQVPVPAIRQIYGLMGVTRDLLPRVKCPTLIMVSPEDHVVPPGNSEFIAKNIGVSDPKRLTLTNSYHVATLDYDKDLINEAVRKFFKAQLV
jgi:carboxylesterase